MAFEAHPLAEGLTLWNVLRVTYLAIFGLYWLYNLAHLCIDLREAAVIAHFTQVWRCAWGAVAHLRLVCAAARRAL